MHYTYLRVLEVIFGYLCASCFVLWVNHEELLRNDCLAMRTRTAFYRLELNIGKVLLGFP